MHYDVKSGRVCGEWHGRPVEVAREGTIYIRGTLTTEELDGLRQAVAHVFCGIRRLPKAWKDYWRALGSAPGKVERPPLRPIRRPGEPS
jgi:hypothetical protein